MKKILTVAAAALLVSGVAFAQAPSGTSPNTGTGVTPMAPGAVVTPGGSVVNPSAPMPPAAGAPATGVGAGVTPNNRVQGTQGGTDTTTTSGAGTGSGGGGNAGGATGTSK